MNPRVLVCGAGSVGRRHIANLKRLGADVSAWRARGGEMNSLAEEFGIPVYADLGRALDACDAVVVATATDKHMEVISAASENGRALFIEKPISHDLENVDRLPALTDGQVVEIGCQLRAHPVLQRLEMRLAAGDDGPIYTFRAAVGQRLDQWRPGTDYRECYSAESKRGGGALLDLIHEIDLVCWLVGDISAVGADLATISDLGIAADDLANLTVTTACGAVGQIQLDMLSPVYRRELELVLRDAVYRWDDQAGVLTRSTENGTDIVDRLPERFSRNDLFVVHMRHFLDRLADPSLAPLCSLSDGIAALKVAHAARNSAAEGRRIPIEAG